MKTKFDKFNFAYAKILDGLNKTKSKKLVSEQVNPEYEGPLLVTAELTDPVSHAANEEMTVEEYMKGAQTMINGLSKFCVKVLKRVPPLLGADGEMDISFKCKNKEELGEFLKSPNIIFDRDSDVGTMIFDLSDASMYADSVDNDLMGAIAQCSDRLKITEISDDDYYKSIRSDKSNLKETLMSDEVIDEVRATMGMDDEEE